MVVPETVPVAVPVTVSVAVPVRKDATDTAHAQVGGQRSNTNNRAG